MPKSELTVARSSISMSLADKLVLARGTVEISLMATDQTGPPVNLKAITKRLGVNKVLVGPTGTDALLRENKGQFEILLKEGVRRRRSRFSWAHELGHLLIDRPMNGSLAHRTNSKENVELACDSIAAEVLMPRSWFMRELRGRGTHLASIESLANRFDVSLPAAARRMLSLTSKEAVLYEWRRAKHGTKRLRPGSPIDSPKAIRGRKPRFPLLNGTVEIPPSVRAAEQSSDVHFETVAMLGRNPATNTAQEVHAELESWAYGSGKYRTVFTLCSPIDTETMNQNTCPECEQPTLAFEEGCKKCYSCGYSKC